MMDHGPFLEIALTFLELPCQPGHVDLRNLAWRNLLHDICEVLIKDLPGSFLGSGGEARSFKRVTTPLAERRGLLGHRPETLAQVSKCL